MAGLSQKEILLRAIHALEGSLAQRPDNPKIALQLAQAYAQAGMFTPKAMEVYEKAATDFPTDVRVQKALSIGYLISQTRAVLEDMQSLEAIDRAGLAKSIERLRALSKTYPDSPELHRALGDLLLISGNHRESIQHYRSSMALGFSDLELICDHFETVRRLTKVPPNVVGFFAEMAQRCHRWEQAHALYLGLLLEGIFDPVTLDAHRAFLERRIAECERERINCDGLLLEIVEVALAQDNLVEAMSWLRQLDPAAGANKPELMKRVARLLIDAEDYRQAFDYLSRIAMDEECKSLLNEITVQLEKKGELDTAVYLLQFINERDLAIPGGGAAAAGEEGEHAGGASKPPTETNELQLEIQTELSLAELHWRNKRWQNALERYVRVLELGYDDYKSILEVLDILFERLPNVPSDTLLFLTKFFSERREWRRVLRYGDLLLMRGESDDTVNNRMRVACEQILQQNPNEPEVRLRLGDYLVRGGALDHAITEYKKALTFPEISLKATRRLAMALFHNGDLKGAHERYKALPVLDNEDLEGLYELSRAFAEARQFKDALECAAMIRDYDQNYRDIAAQMAHYQQLMDEAGAGVVVDEKIRELIGDHAIGRYQYVGKIGSGGMGVVYKVKDLQTQNTVAMKVLREGLSSSGKAIDRFFREARIAATLRHRNIVNIIDYNISNVHGQSYIAMEFVDGPTLREVIEEKFKDTIDITLEDVIQAMHWMSQLCDALEATHKKGIIHRDIKPDNIMVAPGNVIKITDFGIVHIEEATFTPTGALIGTPRYMSPEQVRGGKIDARSDIYAVGIILYEMMIGSPPFISGDIAYQQVNVQPTRPREISPSIPEVVDRIIMKALEKDSNKRYASSMALRADLDSGLEQLGVTPAPAASLTPHTADSFVQLHELDPELDV